MQILGQFSACCAQGSSLALVLEPHSLEAERLLQWVWGILPICLLGEEFLVPLLLVEVPVLTMSGGRL